VTRPTHSGFEPRTRDPERRDFFDLRRRIGLLEGLTGGIVFKGTITTPGPPTAGQAPNPDNGDMWTDADGIGWVWNGTSWVSIGDVATGPPGPQGPPGPPGQAGSDGTGADEVWVGPDEPTSPALELWFDTDAPSASYGFAYVHIQDVPSAMWQIAHNLNYFPSLTVIDSGGSVVEGEIIYVNANQVDVGFSGGFTGTAYLS
jgi:hypothetical protein